MQYTASYGWGPGNTPQTISRLIIITAAISLLCAFTSNFFTYFGVTSPQDFLSLSWHGLSQWYIWQPLSYLFVQSGGQFGITLSFLFTLCFNMYILWIMGASTFERVGKGPFLRFYFITGALTGILTLLLMPILGQYSTLAGISPVILAILMAWTMLHPDNDILLFFILPIKARWLLPAILLLLLLTNISQLNFIDLTFNLLGLLVGYIYAATVWELESPFAFTHFTDRLLTSLGRRLRRIFSWLDHATPSTEAKAEIIDFHTGKSVIDDDLFMDSVLDKISKHGERSLSWSERHRMRKISERKSRKR